MTRKQQRQRYLNGDHFNATSMIWRLSSVGVLLGFLSGVNQAAEISGLLDLRLVQADDTRSWIYGGLGKQRFDDEHDGLRLGQAIAAINTSVLDTVNASIEFNAYEDRRRRVDVETAHLLWRPIPASEWQSQLNVGAFFPGLSLENTGTGWTSPYLLSHSAINNWIGEEVRIIGTEWTLARLGQKIGSPHDWQFSASLFGWNDGSGGLLAWRGWSVGDRISGLSERLPLPSALPIFDEDSDFAEQGSGLKPFHEIDHRTGYTLSSRYRYTNQFEARVLHYDNRGDPTKEAQGQYAWDTHFNALGMRWQVNDHHELLGQWLAGSSLSGDEADSLIDMRFQAWYLLYSWHSDAHRLSLRYDHFWVGDRDINSEDPNGEYGHAYALAYRYQWNERLSLCAEALRQISYRDAREELDLPEDVTEDSLQFAVQMHF